ncbi:hypothetical protein MF672_038925 [Actinomadura sp. ATCC 31491]|uniref:Uncharacterized protein n=1 Tax=Actinomadura luzonensis TaxID=2805427 RepID=A0ABT0G539_9ACTN|nr:hypothetical protein [Actinomadura luzonensis]MCK2219728.1 hypothetical protein [Actinomadura luzonensis]
MPEIDVTTMAGHTWTIPIADRTACNPDALHRATADHGLRAHLIELLWGTDRPTPTSEGQIGGYVWEIADKLATALEGDLLACPPAWECVCGTLNHGQWSSRETCRGCRIEAAKPSQVAAHYRMVPPPAENGVLAKRLEAARARAERASTAEAGNARVRQLHAEIPYKPGTCYCGNPCPCPTIRALDGEDTDRG